MRTSLKSMTTKLTGFEVPGGGPKTVFRRLRAFMSKNPKLAARAFDIVSRHSGRSWCDANERDLIAELTNSRGDRF